VTEATLATCAGTRSGTFRSVGGLPPTRVLRYGIDGAIRLQKVTGAVLYAQ
jgi:hypothetical protein